MHRIAVFLLPVLFLLSCASQKSLIDPYTHIQDQKVVATLKKSFNTMGGLDNWRNIKELHYQKQTKLLLESGAIENEVFQNHDYFYQKKPSINISWKDKDGRHQKVTSIDGTAVKYIDGQLDKDAKKATLNTSVTTSLFVIGVPFKMLDKGVKLSHEGTDVLEDGQKVEVIKAVYDPSENAHHTTPDIWWYYFDDQDSKMVAYMIKHDDHYSYVKNLAFTKSGPFLFPTARGSYRVDSARKILYTRAEYAYEGWKVKL